MPLTWWALSMYLGNEGISEWMSKWLIDSLSWDSISQMGKLILPGVFLLKVTQLGWAGWLKIPWMLHLVHSRGSTNGRNKLQNWWARIRMVGRESACWMKPLESVPRLLLNLSYCDIFCLLDFSGFLPADIKGKQPVQQDWKALGTEQGFFISQVIRNAQQPGSQSQPLFLMPSWFQEREEQDLFRNAAQAHQRGIALFSFAGR